MRALLLATFFLLVTAFGCGTSDKDDSGGQVKDGAVGNTGADGNTGATGATGEPAPTGGSTGPTGVNGGVPGIDAPVVHSDGSTRFGGSPVGMAVRPGGIVHLASLNGMTTYTHDAANGFHLASELPIHGKGTAVSVAGNLAAFAASSGTGAGFADRGHVSFIDVTDPAAPKLVGRYADPAFFEPLGGGYLSTVALKEGLAFFAYNRVVGALDVSDPKAPKLISRLDLHDDSYSFQRSLVTGNLLIESGIWKELKVIDVSNPQAMVAKAVIKVEKETGFCMDGDVLFIAGNVIDKVTGIAAWSLADPATPVALGNTAVKDPDAIACLGKGVVAVKNSVGTVTSSAISYFAYANGAFTEAGTAPAAVAFDHGPLAVEGDVLYSANKWGSLSAADVTSKAVLHVAPVLGEINAMKLDGDVLFATNSGGVMKITFGPDGRPQLAAFAPGKDAMYQRLAVTSDAVVTFGIGEFIGLAKDDLHELWRVPVPNMTYADAMQAIGDTVFIIYPNAQYDRTLAFIRKDPATTQYGLGATLKGQFIGLGAAGDDLLAGTTTGELQIYDVSGATPTKKGAVTVIEKSSTGMMAALGNRIYVSTEKALKVFDATDRAAPVLRTSVPYFSGGLVTVLEGKVYVYDGFSYLVYTPDANGDIAADAKPETIDIDGTNPRGPVKHGDLLYFGTEEYGLAAYGK